MIAVNISIIPDQMSQSPEAIVPTLWSIKVFDSDTNALKSLYIGVNPYTTSYISNNGNYTARAARVTDDGVVVGPIIEVNFIIKPEDIVSVVEIDCRKPWPILQPD